MKKLSSGIILFIPFVMFGQNNGITNLWQGGYSSWGGIPYGGVDINFFNGAPIVSYKNRPMNFSSNATNISDSLGNLLFYTNGVWIADSTDNSMQNGLNISPPFVDDTLGLWIWQATLILPYPDHPNQYFLFHSSIDGLSTYYYCHYLRYSVIDMSMNNGLGSVTSKNNVVLNSDLNQGNISACKHGNGRDWWVLFKRSSFPFSNPPNNEWHEYLITPSGIIGYGVQQIGVTFLGNLGKLCVNPSGNKIAFTHFDGLVETYDFDRCSGIISNARIIEYPNFPTVLYPCNECAFPPNSNLLYVTLSDTFSALIQYNLLDSNPALTKDTLWYYTFPVNGIGAVRRAPDNKLYVSSAYYNGFTWNYPYPDSMYNVYNMNLSVINQPDSLGAACDFQPYSFYLGGKRTYWGLPNNPDYGLGPLVGSPCDTITGLTPGPSPVGEGSLLTTYISQWQKLFVNAQNIKGKNCVLKIFDVNGRELYSSSKQTVPPYYTQDVDVGNLASGIYLVNLITEKETLSAKFVKEK